MSADVALLQEAPLFALLDENERQTLADIIDVVTFPKGATIFGDRPESAVIRPIMPASTAING